MCAPRLARDLLLKARETRKKVHKVQCVEILYYWIVSLEVIRGESESEKSLVGYLKNGAFASLGLGGRSWAYYGSVERK